MDPAGRNQTRNTQARTPSMRYAATVEGSPGSAASAGAVVRWSAKRNRNTSPIGGGAAKNIQGCQEAMGKSARGRETSRELERKACMKVNITWKDIFAGRSMTPSACMVALALKRDLRTAYASVGLRDARVRLDGQFVTLRLPREVGQKIRFWELFHFVLPFSFEFPGLIGTVLAEPTSSALASKARSAVTPEPVF